MTGASRTPTPTSAEVGDLLARLDDVHADMTDDAQASVLLDAMVALRRLARVAQADDLLDQAWGVIANASQGRWEVETPEWQDAATRWRDAWHEHMGIAPGGPPPHRRGREAEAEF